MPKLEDVPQCPPDEEPSPKEAWKTYEIKTITPMVGGGYEAGVPDASFPIRPSAIRGQLRFWWRVVKGYSLGDAMWRREEEIFGSTEFPSSVRIRVSNTVYTKPVDPQFGNRFGPEAYAMFASIENNQQVSAEGIAFNLRVYLDDANSMRRKREAQNLARAQSVKSELAAKLESIEADLESALSAWLQFGGIGARTRRGCGSVHCGGQPAKAPTGWQHVIWTGAPCKSAMEAWQVAVTAYRDFRQNPRGKKHEKILKSGKRVMVPGRSHWPEADSIRKLTGCALTPPLPTNETGYSDDANPHDHSKPIVPAHLLPSFPKALLGLPINFHFADGPGKHQPGNRRLDPQDVQLVPFIEGAKEQTDRMASPVITRPIWNSAHWLPGIIVLSLPTVKGLSFRLEGKRAESTGRDLACPIPMNRASEISLGTLRPMLGKPSAIEALIEFLKHRNWSPS